MKNKLSNNLFKALIMKLNIFEFFAEIAHYLDHIFLNKVYNIHIILNLSPAFIFFTHYSFFLILNLCP